MRTMAEKGLMVAISMVLLFAVKSTVLGVNASGNVPSAKIIAGMLLVLSATGLFDWLRQTTWAWIPVAGYALMTFAIPHWIVFLPVIAYDAARLPSARMMSASPSSTPQLHRFSLRPDKTLLTEDSSNFLPYCITVSHWIWLAPLAAAWLLPVIDVDRTNYDLAGIALIAGIASLGFALGGRSAKEAEERHQLRALQDRAREASRSNRVRLADMDEERAQSVRMATLGERTRIAREIHDNVGHLLTRAIMQAQAGRAVADATGDTMASQHFGALSETLDDAMMMVRRSVHDLEDDGTDFTAQIEAAVRSFNGISPGFIVELENDIASAPAPVSRCCSTVIREALSNVIHHSQARTAQVTLRDFPAFWQLVVQDPGPAIPQQQTNSKNSSVLSRGMGLADIESRVRAIGGTSSCGPYRQGWRVFVSVPKQQWNRSMKEAA
ncbi:sensor histidine kinase [Bifidobacterium scaligerum]|uniref:histidine kinase n=1 Tax=Bifidobacterium scaligerum TaxID=2052656 RepID=A0A2M9HSQ1_9BIFI|nr:histidine kinase [Bifidobacterium scaligerum]PJM79846.1 two-component sensor histidine kinase [Bifidobacterium scaligerum]